MGGWWPSLVGSMLDPALAYISLLLLSRLFSPLQQINSLITRSHNKQPFFSEILSAGNTKLAAFFIPKCSSSATTPVERVDMWVKCGLPLKAAEEAFRVKNVALLEDLRDKVASDSGGSVGGTSGGSTAAGEGLRSVRDEVDRFIARLRPNR